MLHLLLGLVLLFLVSALLRWWARGGVIPAIMLSAPILALLAVSDHPDASVMLLTLLCLGVAWAPRLWAWRVRAPGLWCWAALSSLWFRSIRTAPCASPQRSAQHALRC